MFVLLHAIEHGQLLFTYFSEVRALNCTTATRPTFGRSENVCAIRPVPRNIKVDSLGQVLFRPQDSTFEIVRKRGNKRVLASAVLLSWCEVSSCYVQ